MLSMTDIYIFILLFFQSLATDTLLFGYILLVIYFS